jgi:16S rRNA (uracil1498-N3)-methyltransferase
MRDHRHFLFYSDTVETNLISLEREEAHHAVTVLRLEPGDPFLATNGRGTIFECRCSLARKNSVTGTIIARTNRPRHGCSLHFMVGMPEKAAFETVVYNLSVMGVTRITPLVCRHCQQAWWQRSWANTTIRVHGKMIAAIKQALYPWLPHLDNPVPFHKACSMIRGFCIVADPGGTSISTLVSTLGEQQQPFTIIVGPPGGLANEEISDLKARGAVAVAIAPTRLSTELAATVVAGQIFGAWLMGSDSRPSPGAAA